VVSEATSTDIRAAADRLRHTLIAARNTDGGWGYYAGKTSRLEPTCWAVLALDSAQSDPPLTWLARCERPTGWLIENEQWPINITYNALATFTLLGRSESAPSSRRLLASVVASKGLAAPPAETMRQDNSLQGWSWIESTFSWVEPTCWGLLALKKARAAGITDAAANSRIDEAERLLIDRCCQPGGWNFGNASVMKQDLRPYVPTTALGLLAMQDRPATDAVARSLNALETLWPTEISAPALGLSLLALGVYGRPIDRLVSALTEHAADALTFGNYHGLAVALCALSSVSQRNVFKL
jgi:hypothetical protein